MASHSSEPESHARITGREIELSLVSTLGSIRAHSATRLAWHSHENVELIFLLGGATSYEFSGSGRVELSSGQFLLVPTKTLHRGGQEMRMPSVLCGIVLEPFSRKTLKHTTFTNADIHRFQRCFCGESPRIGTMNGALLTIAKGLAEEVRIFKSNPSDALVPARIRASVCLALLEVVAILDRASPRAETGIVAEAEAFLRNRHADSVTMDELATYLGFSRARMFAIFKKATGLSPNDYLQRHRVECAKELLRKDGLSITDVALNTGFESSQYFSRVFRKYCGITPTEFREQFLDQ